MWIKLTPEELRDLNEWHIREFGVPYNAKEQTTPAEKPAAASNRRLVLSKLLTQRDCR
jgi:hypothetical protein